MTVVDSDTERLWDARNAMREIARAAYVEPPARAPQARRRWTSMFSGLGLVIAVIGALIVETFIVLVSLRLGVLLLVLAIIAVVIDRRDRGALIAYEPFAGWPVEGSRDGLDPAVDFLLAYWPGRAPNVLLWSQGSAEQRRSWLQGDRLIVVIDAPRASDTVQPPMVFVLWAATQTVDLHRHALPGVLWTLAPPNPPPPARPVTPPPAAPPDHVADAFLTALRDDDPATVLLHGDPFIHALADAEPDAEIWIDPPTEWQPTGVDQISDDTRKHDFSAVIDGERCVVSLHLTRRAGRWLVRGVSYANQQVFGYAVPRG